LSLIFYRTKLLKQGLLSFSILYISDN
jgi:hypothetical protein